MVGKNEAMMMFEDENQERERFLRKELFFRTFFKNLIPAGLEGMDSLLDDQMAGMKMKIRVMIMSARIVASDP